MALSTEALKVLSPYLRGARILSLGYPDLLITEGETEKLLGVRPTEFTDHGSWHKVKHRLPETVSLIKKLGSSIECVDIHASRGVERIVDLNEKQDFGSFDLVIDAGTTEHCFNIGQALMNAAGSVKTGGVIFHSPPMTMVNHGFYNICPTLLWDFYTQNNWTVEHLSAYSKQGIESVHPTARIHCPHDVWIFCLAKRNTGNPLIFPRQTKYITSPNL